MIMMIILWGFVGGDISGDCLIQDYDDYYFGGFAEMKAYYCLYLFSISKIKSS